MIRLFKSIVFISLTTFAGCIPANHGHRSEPHVLRIADWSEPSSLNPLLAHDQDSIGLSLLFCQTLVGISRGNAIVPVLVTRVPSRANGDISSDGRTITYHLRSGLRFADGVPLRSSDVAFTFHAIMDPRNPIQSQDAYRRIISLTTPSATTVVIKLRAPWNAAVRELFAESDYAFGILPAHAFTTTVLQGSVWEQNPFGTGPFRVTRWARGDRIVLEPNQFFSPKPKLSRIEFRMIPDLNSVIIALRTGEVDAARLPPIFAAQIRSEPELQVLSTPINGADYLSLQTAAAPTSELRVRQAIAYAIDAPKIARALHTSGAPSAAFLPPTFAWHDNDLKPASQSLQRAEQLLDAAGWKKIGARREKSGVRLEVLIVAQAGGSGAFAAILQRELATAGIAADIKLFPASSFNGVDGPLRTGRFNIAAEGWIGGADPEQSVAFACSQIGPNGANISRFCDARFDAAYADQMSVSSDRRRASDFRTMQRIIYAEAPIIPLTYTHYFDAENIRVTGFARNMLGYPVKPEIWDAR
jgi:peptide/nickel transport system substrate-binding protein